MNPTEGLRRTASGGLAELVRDAVTSARSTRTAAAMRDALMSVPAASIAAFLHASFVGAADADSDAASRTLLTSGLGASPGAACGAIVLDAAEAVDAAGAGRDVILVRNETTPDDVLGMQAARGVITVHGGLASHAAVVARGWGIPAVVGAGAIEIRTGGIAVRDRWVPRGTVISIDGRTGEVLLGGAAVETSEPPAELEPLLRWADRVRAGADRPVGVRANADTAADAAHARHLGADGLGLCRTEHMFLAEDRLPLVRRFILADDPGDEAAALAELESAQRADFEAIVAAMDGLPITVRLLDPPLHEFLPDLERLVVAEAMGRLDDAGRADLAAVRRLREANPMIGTRGVRLGVVRPGVYQMQVRALCAAIARLVADGRRPDVEVMIPLVVHPSEMVAARGWVDEAMAEVGAASAVPLRLGAMIETPRAALVAGELAGVSEFFSFGTNDLTQLTFAFSRDDVGSRLLPLYLQGGLLPADPFETLDEAGVGKLIADACRDARAVRPEITIGICGEHAGDPASARFLVDAGVDHVSCSPYRVPIARLAIAQALLAAGRVPPSVLEAIAADPDAGCAEVVAPVTADRPPAADVDGPGSDEARGSGEADVEFAILHALRIKGFATVEGIADVACVAPAAVLPAVQELVDRGLARHIAARDLYQLLPAGRDRHAELLATESVASAAGLRPHYEAFLDLNLAFKELCTAWQTRDGDPNDHADAAYDAARVADLAALHARAEPVLVGLAAGVDRFEGYRHRLATAVARLTAGEARMFTGVMCGSYHDVWMELHEDLIQLLGVDRHSEGSF